MVNVKSDIVQHRPADGQAHLIARVTIDNQARRNCLSRSSMDEITRIITQLSAHEELRAVVLTGAGDRAFIGGADLRELGSLDPDSARLMITSLHQACEAIRRCPVPVIARINGFCLGAGPEIAASCDMRAASDTAVFGMPEVHMGLPSVIEAALLPGLIGWGKTREILLTGDTFGAAEALQMRLVEKVVSPEQLDAAVDVWVNAICRAAPEAVRSQKALIARWERSSVEEGIYAGIDALSDAYRTGEPQQRIADFFAERKNRKS